MDNEAEKKEIIEKLIAAWIDLIPNPVRYGPNWDEEDAKKVLRRKAYELYGITS